MDEIPGPARTGPAQHRHSAAGLPRNRQGLVNLTKVRRLACTVRHRKSDLCALGVSFFQRKKKRPHVCWNCAALSNNYGAGIELARLAAGILSPCVCQFHHPGRICETLNYGTVGRMKYPTIEDAVRQPRRWLHCSALGAQDNAAH